jgi:hypothetical protein
MKIAVIIPVYNHERFVGEAIESVLAQTRPADAILVIDDGSKDGSLAVAQSFADRGVKSRGQENQNAFNTINSLVKWAHEEGCDWVNILNSDDRFLPGKLAACAAFAEAHPEKQVVSTRLQVIDDQGQLMAPDTKRARWFYGAQSLTEQPYASVAELMGKANFIATTSNVFARTDYLLANPFRPYHFNHDYFFLAGAAWRDLIGLVPEVHMEYRVHGNNTITTRPEPLIREMLRMHLDLYRHYADELAASATMRERFFDYCRAQWESISSFHAGMFQVAVAQLVGQFDESQLQRLAQVIAGPEFDVSPNKALSGSYTGAAPLSSAALSAKVDELRAERSKAMEEREAAAALAKLRHQIASSRWMSLGNLLGFTRALRGNQGKGAAEKVAHTTTLCAEMAWVRWGAKLGSSTARSLVS